MGKKVMSNNFKKNPFNIPLSPPSIGVTGAGLTASIGNRSILSISRKGRDSVNMKSIASYKGRQYRMGRGSTRSKPSSNSPVQSSTKSPTFRSRPTTQENDFRHVKPIHEINVNSIA